MDTARAEPDLAAPPFSLGTDAAAWVERTLASLDDRQLVGQLMCVYLRDDDVADWSAANTRIGLEPGGILLLSRPREAAVHDVRALQEASAVPLLVAANLESGGVNFIEGAEAFATPMQVAATGDARYARLLAEHCVGLADEIGINWAFAPVVDPALNPANPITGTRSFGSDPGIVIEHAVAYLRELEAHGIATSPKHFPGDGLDPRDQHLLTTSNDLDATEWWETYGRIYRAVIAAGARTIMVGHIRQPALSRRAAPGIDGRDLMPATLAPELLQGVLRDGLGFGGLVVSDNTAMAGFTTVLPRELGLPRAIASGIDMVLGNLDVTDDLAILLRAVDDGSLPRERVRAAVRRVLATKASIGLHVEDGQRFRSPRGTTGDDGARRDELASRATTLVKDTQSLLPLNAATHRRALVYVLGDEPTFYDPSGPFAPQFVRGLEKRGMAVEVRRVPGSGTTPAEAERLHERFDVCIYFANVRFVGNANVSRVTWSPWQGGDAPRHVASLPTVLVSIADPYLLQDVPMIRTAVNGYTPSPSTVEAALAGLFGESPMPGVSPVDPFAGRWDAAL